MRILQGFLVVASAALLSACVAPPKYNWGSYDGTLYGYYKDPTRLDAHVAELESIIRSSDRTGAKAAPGLHAEYGYFLMQNGKTDAAVAQFGKEKTDWPESAQLMSSMIKLAAGQPGKSVSAKDQ